MTSDQPLRSGSISRLQLRLSPFLVRSRASVTMAVACSLPESEKLLRR